MVKKIRHAELETMKKYGLSDSDIASKLGVSERTVRRSLERRKSKSDGTPSSYTRRMITLAGAVLILGGAVGIYKFGVPDYQRMIPGSIHPLDKFKSLPQPQQKEIIDTLDKFVLESTSFGRTIKELSDLTKTMGVGEVVDSTFPEGRARYLNEEDKIVFGPVSLEFQASNYLAESPDLALKGHERLHVLQRKASQWDRYFSMMQPYFYLMPNSRIGVNLSAEQMHGFIKALTENPKISFKDAEKEYFRLTQLWESTDEDRSLVQETQAYLTFGQYTKPDNLFEKFTTDPYYGGKTGKVNREKFDRVYQATVELMGILPPIEAAKLAGANFDSVDNYVAAVNSKKKELGIQDAYQRGLAKQHELARELGAVKAQAIKVIMSK